MALIAVIGLVGRSMFFDVPQAVAADKIALPAISSPWDRKIWYNSNFHGKN